MGGRDIVVWLCAIAVATALTVFGTVKLVNWYMPSDPYGSTVKGTGVLPKSQ